MEEYDPCAAVALETLVTHEASKTYRLEIGLVVEESSAAEIGSELRTGLQHKLAPELTDCAGERRRLDANRNLAGAAMNVVFGTLEVTSFRKYDSFFAASSIWIFFVYYVPLSLRFCSR